MQQGQIGTHTESQRYQQSRRLPLEKRLHAQTKSRNSQVSQPRFLPRQTALKQKRTRRRPLSHRTTMKK